MLTKDILFGMNILTLVGLVMTGFGLTLRRVARAGVPLCVGFMRVGTVLVLEVSNRFLEASSFEA